MTATGNARPYRTFKRAMFIAAALSVALFCWTVFMVLWFNQTPASVRFGTGTLVKLASVALPGPVLIVFLAFKAWSKGARGLGWVAAAGSVFAAGLLALYSTLLLRPLVGAGAYDDAAREAETAGLALVNADSAAMLDSKAVRERLAQGPTDAAELSALAARMRSNARAVAGAGEGMKGLRRAIIAPFESRGIGRTRAGHFADLYLGPLTVGGIVKTYADTAAAFDARGAQIEVLAKHTGKWSWSADGAPVFEDAQAREAYVRAGEPGLPMAPAR